MENIREFSNNILSMRISESSSVIELSGDLDVNACQSLIDECEQSILNGNGTAKGDNLTFDLRSLDFIDSAGIATLLFMRNTAKANEQSFRVVVREGSQPARVFTFGKFGSLLNVSHDLVCAT